MVKSKKEVQKDAEKLPLNLIKKEMLSRIIIVFREFLHLVLVWRFYRTYRPHDEKVSSLRASFKSLDLQIKNVWEDIKKGNLSDRIKEFFYSLDSFERIVEINNDTEKILNQIGFLQKKISYTLEAFPSYYPAPNIFRSRQELNAYNSLQDIAKEYIDWFIKNIFESNDKKNVVTTVYWETDAINEFIFYSKEDPAKEKEKENKNIIFSFKGSFYMVNQHSLWIILTHEVFHYLIRWYEKNDRNNKFFTELEKHYQSFLETMAALTEHMNMEFPESQWIKALFEDSVCDSLLTYAFGEPYFAAIWRLLFGFDEDETHYAVSHWWIRLRTSLDVLEKYYSEEYRSEGIYFEKFLENIHEDLQKRYPFTHDRCIIEQEISSILKYYINDIIDDKKEELQTLKKESKFFKLFQLLSDRFKQIDIEKFDQLKEGRIWSEACSYGYNIDGNFLAGCENVQVILLSFMKIRFDGYPNRKDCISFIEKLFGISSRISLKDENCFLFYHIGPFCLVYIDCNYRDKKFKIEEWQDTIEALVNMEVPNGEGTDRNNQKIDQKSIVEELLCYEEDIALNAVYFLKIENGKLQPIEDISGRGINSENRIEEVLRKLKDFFRESQNTVLILVQAEIEMENNTNEKDFFTEKMSKFDAISYCEKILIFHTSTWANWAFLIKLKDNCNYEDIIKIKKSIHKEKAFHRTKTDILVGMNANVTIPAPELLIRFSGESRETDEADNTDGEISAIGSAITNWDTFLLPGVFDVVLRYNKKAIKTCTLKNIIHELIKFSKGKSDKPLISDIQFQLYLPVNSTSR